MSALAQTNAAAMAVRQQVEGLQGGQPPQGPESSPPANVPPGGPTAPGAPAAGGIDTRFISPNAAVVVAIRPGQILAAPIAQVFPVEVASAAGMQFLGFDPKEIDEVVAFGEPFNPAAPGYGATFKFKNPIRASSIVPDRRAHAQLAELAGKKYLKSSVPMLYSLYGPNNRTLVIAPDAMLQSLVQSAAQPKSGPMLERVRQAAAGSDLYLALDLVPLRPFIQMGLTQAQAQIPPEAKAYMDVPNLVSAIELTLNLSSPGPSSLVLHCNDEAAAQKLESLMQEGMQKYRSAQQAQAATSPFGEAMTRYSERISQPFQPQRNGTSITCFHLDGHDPAQQQMLTVSIIGACVAMLLPAVQAAREAARRAQAKQASQGPIGPEGGPPAASAEPTR